MDRIVRLPRRLDVSAGIELRETLLQRRGSPLELDASAVESVSGLALEMIVAAARQWAEDGAEFSFAAPSDGFAAACRTLGLEPQSPWEATAAAVAQAEVEA